MLTYRSPTVSYAVSSMRVMQTPHAGADDTDDGGAKRNHYPEPAIISIAHLDA